MPIKLKNINVIKAELGIEPKGKAQKYFTDACYKYMDKYVPMSDTIHKGDLRSIVDIGADYITYLSPYASYQYYGEREDGTRTVKNHTTPGTGNYWDARMTSVDIANVVEEVRAKMAKGG